MFDQPTGFTKNKIKMLGTNLLIKDRNLISNEMGRNTLMCLLTGRIQHLQRSDPGRTRNPTRFYYWQKQSLDF